MSDTLMAERALWNAIHADAGASEAVLRPYFYGDERLDAAGRVDIYVQMYQARLVQTLREDFAWTARLVGDEEDAFAHLVRAYLRHCPLKSFSLADVGEQFSAFLALQPLRADLHEIAALERMRTRVAMAAATTTLDMQALRAHGAQLVSMRCAFVPGMCHTRVTHDVCGVVDALVNHPEAPPPAPRRQPAEVVAWWRNERVYHTALFGPAAAALRSAAAGDTIAEICGAFADCSDPAQEAFAALGAWFADGWVRDLV